ncbi:MAG: DUF6531 domain-containing protein, partial [Fimbriimonadales bacterium]|nr:DUF6531 domain-containing protein [Fimbriimonadales bacterium]
MNTNTGNRLASLSLLSWTERGGLVVSFTLYHNSKGDYQGEFGHSWSHTYDVNIAYTPNSSAIVRWGDGLTIPYVQQTDGSFRRPAGIHDQLVRNPDGTWTITTHSQTRFFFNSQGVLTSIRDRNGNHVTINVNEQGLPLSVVGPSGRQLTFSYDANGRVAQITDPGGRVWSFIYNASDNLVRINY